ncbi:MAG: tetratricopeptide repeat protein [Candidatus Delongbacteria bacterium]|nr:tetratricopeptide repeat protein [Candidatus Delongbacteria bacterium]
MKSKILVFLLMLLTVTLTAENSILLKGKIITIECSGISFIGSGITVDDAKKFAVNDAKRNALEQVGTYLESNMTILNHIVTKDEIQTYTAGILKTEIISSKKKITNDVFAIEVKVKCKIDTKFLDDRLSKIENDSQLKKTLEEQKKLNDKLTKQIVELKKQNKGFKKKSKKIARSLEASDWFDLGLEAYYKEKYDIAIKNYNKAILLDSGIAVAYNNRGLVYFAQKEYAKAVKDFNKGIKLDPKLAMIYNNVSLVYYNLKQYDKAIQHFSKALKIAPTLEQVYYNRGFAYYKLKNHPKCIKDLNKYLRLSGNKNGDEGRIKRFIKKLRSTVTIPDFVGKELNATVIGLNEIGISNITKDFGSSDTVKKGYVIKYSPPFGEEANNIDGVKLVVSSGPAIQYTTVPNLYNRPLSKAKQLIKDANLIVGNITKVTDIDKGFDRIIGQSIRNGKKVKQGSIIDLTLNVETRDDEW